MLFFILPNNAGGAAPIMVGGQPVGSMPVAASLGAEPAVMVNSPDGQVLIPV